LMDSANVIAEAAGRPKMSLLEAKPAGKGKGKGKGKKGKGKGKKGKGKKGKGKGKGKGLFSSKASMLKVAAGKTPADAKAKALNDKLYQADSAFEFMNLPTMPAVPAKTTELIVKTDELRKKLIKELAKEGAGYMKRIKKYKKKAKKLVEEKEWSELKGVHKKIKKLEKKMKSWILRRDAVVTLKEAGTAIEGWRDTHNDFVENVNENFNKRQSAKVKKLRAKYDKYAAAKNTKKMTNLKLHALKALKHDLHAIKGKAMRKFAKKYKAALEKKFGKKKVKKAMRKKGLKGLKKVTKGQAGAILISVASHLPTVGPYIRARLVSDQVGDSAIQLVRRY